MKYLEWRGNITRGLREIARKEEIVWPWIENDKFLVKERKNGNKTN